MKLVPIEVECTHLSYHMNLLYICAKGTYTINFFRFFKAADALHLFVCVAWSELGETSYGVSAP